MAFGRHTLISLTMSGLVLLTGCGGGGGGGGGGGQLPTASNAAISPPPTSPVAIVTDGDNGTTNTTIASAAYQSLDGAGLQTLGMATGVVGVDTRVATAETTRLSIAGIVRRHAEKIRDSKDSAAATGAQVVQTIPCSVSGTMTFAYDDVSGDAAETYVNCDEGGVVLHGTIASTLAGYNVILGDTAGSGYTIEVSANVSIDFSIRDTYANDLFVTQGAFSFGVTFGGIMVDGVNGLQPGVPTYASISFSGTSLLATDGVHTERLSNFGLTVLDDDATSTTTITGGFTYASSAIGGSVTVNIVTPIVYDYVGPYPSSGAFEITSSAGSGKILVTVLGAAAGVRVDVYADAPTVTNSYTLDWPAFEGLV